MHKKETVTSLLREALVFARHSSAPGSADFIDRAVTLLTNKAEAFGRVRQSALDRGLCGKPKKHKLEDRIKIGREEGTLAARAKKYNLSIETVRKYQQEAKLLPETPTESKASE